MNKNTIDKAGILHRLDFLKFYKERIPSLRINGKPEAVGLCCFHPDKTPSLSVNIETGLYHCFSCGARGDVFTFHQETNSVDFHTALKELAAIAGVVDTSKPKVVATFKYADMGGNLLYTKERIEPGKNGRSKEFIFKHAGVYGRGCDPVLYRLPEVLKSETVYIVEGEAKADLLNSWGLVATCLDSGAKSPWKDEYVQYFAGKKVVILPDNDKPGKEYASKIAQALCGNIAKETDGLGLTHARDLLNEPDEIKVVELPGLQEKGDIIDWAKMPGNDKETLLEIVENTAEWFEETTEPDIHHSKAKNFSMTDMGNARRLVTQHGRNIRYCHAIKKWLLWDGKRWCLDNQAGILRLAKATAASISLESYKMGGHEQLAKWAWKSQFRDKLLAMVSLAESESEVLTSPGERDADKYLLNCSNGTIDLRTGELKPHNPANLITKIIPVKYDPESTCPAWIEFLETFFNWNYDIIPFVQRAVGYSLTGDTSEQCLFIPHGEGENGKSTFVDTVSMLMGEYGQAANVETFMVKKNDGGILNDIARMKGARFISAVETEEGKRLSEVLVKQLTGGDTLSARFLYGEFFDFKPEAKIWLACNHKPTIRGTDHAIWRRIKLIPFTVKISPEKKLPKEKVMAMFRDELSGILAWAVQGCLEWQRNGLQTPDEVQAATGKYREEMDTVGQFLDDTCILTPEVKAKASDLYDAYKTWCDTNGEYVLTQRNFGSRLTQKGLERVKTNGNFWKGVGIKN